MRSFLARMIATVGGLGDVLPAPGTTVGSVAGAALFWAATSALGAHARAVALVGLALVTPVAIWACGVEAARRGQSDPGPVVADEVAGQWLALSVVAFFHPVSPSLTALAAAFLAFRLFDIAKPWPIRRIERLPAGWGIVLDDLAAGLAAGFLAVLVLKLT